ncbi:tricarboxylate transporter [Roseivivax marinus]|uniref:tricarboxylate transporter n=1 Tax=Roseivivax marinus TaxID=1379903 RepID=UPI001F049C38|nr:tricarboxylate transporter [Roseivivax marinus]UMA64394.1 tricarboxylate transporter [Roseivivax marinus]
MDRNLFLAGIAALATPIAATAQEVSFEGETIEIVVPFGVGGATFVSAKFLEPYFEKHLPGNPEIEVVDRPGGGSLLGANWFEQNANSDGTTILFTTSSTANPFVLGQEGVEYRLSDYRVAFSHPFGSVAYTSPATGVTEASQIKEAEQPLVYGGIAAAASDLPALLSFEVLDLEVKSVLGFNGRGPVRLAFEQGSVNLDYQFTPVYLTQVVPSVEEGNAIALWTGGGVDENGALTQPDPVAPELPPVYEVYRSLYGEDPSGIEWDAFQSIASVTYAYGLTGYMHPDTPQEVLDAFAQTVEAINADPEFQEESQEVTNGARLNAGPQTEEAIKSALQPSEEVRSYLRDLLMNKYGVNF